MPADKWIVTACAAVSAAALTALLWHPASRWIDARRAPPVAVAAAPAGAALPPATGSRATAPLASTPPPDAAPPHAPPEEVVAETTIRLLASQASPAVRQLVWRVIMQDDQQGLPFMVVDKRQARLFVFDAHGELVDHGPVLLGQARGDDSVPGIGERPVDQVRPFERTTPAGRFVARHGHNATGEDVVWVDYGAAVSMHRVRALVASERRLQRLASSSAADNRISFGCINLPPALYEQAVLPLLAAGKGSRAIVYVLPERKPMRSLFKHLFDEDDVLTADAPTARRA